MKKILLIITGSIVWLLTMVKSGLNYNYGIGFWGANGHDGIWHIALANNFSRLSFQNPVFSGLPLQNYHYGFDLILALANKITTIPISILYFQLFPIFFAILIGYLVYYFVNIWTNNSKAAMLSTIFTYIGGSAAWIIGSGESAFWSQQAISTLINPPFALSLIFLITGLICLQKNKLLLSILLFGLLIQIKVYAGLLIIGGLFLASIYEVYRKENYNVVKVFIGTLIVSLAIFIPFNKNPGSFINWQPFWFLETMMSYSDRIGWQRFYSAMTTYKMGHIWLKEILAFGLAFLIFIVGNFWTRLIFLKDIFKKIDANKIIMLSIIGAGLFIPMFFVQSGTPWNTIQFIYYSLFFAGILAGISISKYGTQVIVLIFLLTLPTTYLTLKDVYIPLRPPAMLSKSESEALNFLKSQPEGVVLTYLYDADKAKAAVNNPPRPLYLYESTAYVSAFSNKQVFLEDEVNLNIMGYDWKTRRENVSKWYKEANSVIAQQFLKENNIKYVYWVKPQRALLGETQLGLKLIFENKESIIYKYGENLGGN